jgi:hypothetical protein
MGKMGIFGVTNVSDKFNLDRIYAMFRKDFQIILLLLLLIIIIIITIINIIVNSQL